MGPAYACTLGPDELRERVAQWRELAADELERRVEGAGLTVRYRASPDVARRLRWLVDAERRCCPFLSFELGEEGDAIRMVVTAPAPELLPTSA